MTRKVKFPHLILNVWFENPSGREGFCFVNGWLELDGNRSLYSSDVAEGGKYRGVFFRVQGDYDSLAATNRGPLYSHPRLEFKGDHQGLSELKKGVTALADLDRKMDAAYARFGAPASFGAWVQRVCFAIGLGSVSVVGKESILEPTSAAFAIDSRIEEWRASARNLRGLAADGFPLNQSG